MITDLKESFGMLVVAVVIFVKHLLKLLAVGVLVTAAVNVLVLGCVYGGLSASRGHALTAGEFGHVLDSLYAGVKGK